MNNTTKRWDRRLGTKESSDDRAIAWPVMMKIIDDNRMMDNCRVLDYRCGTGEFSRHMNAAGLHVEGMDPSKRLVQEAAKQSSRKIRYYTGGKEELGELGGTYDVITSMMGFHFVEDFDAHLPLFKALLKERGIVVFSVFNPEFVESCSREGAVFSRLRTVGDTTVASMETKKDVFVDAYVRSKDQYKKLFETHGFDFLSSRYPPFTQAFVEEHGWTLPTEDAEYLVMAVRKRS